MAIPLYTSAQIRELEIASHGCVPSLMQRAATAALQKLQTLWPSAKHINIVCGNGNNGNDGYALANLAMQQGLNVTIFYLPGTNLVARPGLPKCEQLPLDKSTLTALGNADVIVDALIGIGLTGPLREPLLEAIHAINNTDLPVLALDIPSGVNADTGAVTPVAVHATHTLTFIGMKPGLVAGPALDYIGQVSCHDLELNGALLALMSPDCEVATLTDYAHLLAPRARDSHKGHYGHVLIVGGDYGMSGAVYLAAGAALRTGAGLVSVVTRAEHVGLSPYPEVMCHKSERLDSVLPRASVIALGPGLGRSTWGLQLVERILATDLPIVLDADGLNLLASLQVAPRENWILTPHPGEAARLLGQLTTTIQQDRLLAARSLQQRYGGSIVLKGAGSIVASPSKLTICPAGNPGMSSGGMGDVLTGIIAACIAQQIPLHLAAQVGVGIHAAAGDLAAQPGERGLIASDVIASLRTIVNPAC